MRRLNILTFSFPSGASIRLLTNGSCMTENFSAIACLSALGKILSIFAKMLLGLEGYCSASHLVTIRVEKCPMIDDKSI